MKNLRITQKDFVDTEPMGFSLAKKGVKPDFCVRVLGAARGSLSFFDQPRTTTLDIKAHDGKLKEVRELFEQVVLEGDDFFFSVSIPYVDKWDLLRKVEQIFKEKQ